MSYFSKVALNDDYGNDIEGTMTNQLKVAESHRLAGGVFNNTIDSNFYTVTNVSGGTTTATGMEAALTLTTTSGSSTSMTTGLLARYMGANMNYFRSVIRLGDTGATSNVRIWGCGDTAPIVDGCFFRLSGTTFSVVARKGSVDTVVNSGSFNGDGTLSGVSYALDTNYHTFEVYYTTKRSMFVIDGTPIHTITATTTPMTNTRHFRPVIQNTNTGVGTAVSIFCTALTISRYGSAVSQAKSSFTTGTQAGVTLKTGPGSLHSLFLCNLVNGNVVTLYDNTAASGTIIWASGTIAIGAGNNAPDMYSVPMDGDGGVQFTVGLTLVVSGGAGCNVLVKYE